MTWNFTLLNYKISFWLSAFFIGQGSARWGLSFEDSGQKRSIQDQSSAEVAFCAISHPTKKSQSLRREQFHRREQSEGISSWEQFGIFLGFWDSTRKKSVSKKSQKFSGFFIWNFLGKKNHGIWVPEKFHPKATYEFKIVIQYFGIMKWKRNLEKKVKDHHSRIKIEIFQIRDPDLG